MKDGNFYQMREKWNNAHKLILDKRLFLICDVREAIILSYLIDKYFAKEGKTFKCPAKMLEAFCGTKSTTQKEIIKTLTYKGFIEVGRTRTIPPTRTVTVKMEVINASVEEKQAEGMKAVFGLRNRTNHNPPKTGQLIGRRPINLLFHNKLNKKQSTNTERSTSENNNEFISHKNKNKVCHQDVDLARAEALAKGLSRRNKILVSYSIKRWANEFAKLRDKDGIENETISSVLNWYIENIGEKYIPQAYSAKAFRSKFPRLAERAEKTKPVVVCEEVKELARQLQMYHEWPKGTKGDVPEALQICYNNYIIFWDKLKSNIKKLNKINFPKTKKSQRDRLRSYYQYLLKAMPNNLKFAEQWMMQVNAMICGWDKWQGELKSMAWNGNMTNKRFNAFALSFDWGDTGTNWEYIKRIVAL